MLREARKDRVRIGEAKCMLVYLENTHIRVSPCVPFRAYICHTQHRLCHTHTHCNRHTHTHTYTHTHTHTHTQHTRQQQTLMGSLYFPLAPLRLLPMQPN